MAAFLDGVTLFKCFDIVSRCGVELNGLIETLNGLIDEKFRLSKDELPCVRDDAKPTYSGRYDDSGWVYRDIAYSFPLKAPRKKTGPDMYFGYQVSMIGDGMQFPGNSEPLLHVFLWNCPIDLNEQYIHFPFVPDESLSVVDSRLAVWGEIDPSNWLDRQWCFSLRLTTLNGPEELLERVVKPTIALLKLGRARDALPDGLTGMMTYPDVQTLTDEVIDNA